MNRSSLKYILLTIFVIYTIFGGHPSIELLIAYLIFAVAPLLLLFFTKLDVFNLLLLWIICVMFQQSGRLGLPMLPDIFADRIVWILMFSIFTIELMLKKRTRILPISSMEVAMIGLSILSLFSMFISGTFFQKEGGLAIGFYLVSFGFPFSMFFISKNIVDDEKKIEKIFLFFVLLGGYLGFIGIFEHLKLNQFVFPRYIMNQYKGIHWGRARGPFLNAGVNGMSIAIFIFTSMYLFYFKVNKLKKFLTGIAICLMLVTFIFTFTRSPWIGFLLGALTVFIFLPKVRKVFLVGFSIIIIFMSMMYVSGKLKPNTQSIQKEGALSDAISTRTMSMDPIYSRIIQYEALWRMFLDKPFFGFGLNTIKQNMMKYYRPIEGMKYWRESSNHNTFLGLLIEVGLVGFSIYLYILFSIFRMSLILYRRLPEEGFICKKLVAIFWAILIVYLVTLQGAEYRNTMFPNALIFIIAGIFQGLYQRILQGEEVKASG